MGRRQSQECLATITSVGPVCEYRGHPYRKVTVYISGFEGIFAFAEPHAALRIGQHVKVRIIRKWWRKVEVWVVSAFDDAAETWEATV